MEAEGFTAELEGDDSSQLSDMHVGVVETATGKQLKGEEAPLLSQLHSWLEAHPGWEELADDSEDEDDEDEDEEGASQDGLPSEKGKKFSIS